MKITKTISAYDVKKEWFILDATDLILGRVASHAAVLLRGKEKPFFSHNIDCGSKLVIINVSKLNISNKKMENKIYYSHSHYPNALKEVTLKQLLEKHPTKALQLAVKRMMPKNKLSDLQLKSLYLIADDKNPHSAHNPTPITLPK